MITFLFTKNICIWWIEPELWCFAAWGVSPCRGEKSVLTPHDLIFRWSLKIWNKPVLRCSNTTQDSSNNRNFMNRKLLALFSGTILNDSVKSYELVDVDRQWLRLSQEFSISMGLRLHWLATETGNKKQPRNTHSIQIKGRTNTDSQNMCHGLKFQKYWT